MIKLRQILRLMQINWVLSQHTFNRSVLGSHYKFLRFLSYFNPLSFIKQGKTRGESIRMALESLGPIFVKFGQLLSTRRDLLPTDIISELERLQDQVPPFPSKQAISIIEKTYDKPISALFTQFDETPLASASIAQVHAATLEDGSDVIVKIIRPKIEKIIRHDISLMYAAARLTLKLWSQAKRLHPVELVAEFEQTITDELDLMREAGNASQLRRNFQHSDILYVPKVYWPYTRRNVMVMERIHGIQISNIDALKACGTNLKKLGERGVEIFFTQVFRDSFFHADMHPGNLFVDASDPENPRYIGVDFGIMGTLSPSDQRYLARNLFAFFTRDYRQVALLHIQSGWVAADTRVDQFESAIRTVCEPIFERPLKEISFGQLLLRLFQTAKRFNMEVQPQLMLLQKTLLGIEALGRQLYPDLDLWITAKPFMIRWMRKQRSLKRLSKMALKDWHLTTEKMIHMPQLAFDVLQQIRETQSKQPIHSAVSKKNSAKKRSKRRGFFWGLGIAFAVSFGVSLFYHFGNIEAISTAQWAIAAVAGLSLIIGAALTRKNH